MKHRDQSTYTLFCYFISCLVEDIGLILCCHIAILRHLESPWESSAAVIPVTSPRTTSPPLVEAVKVPRGQARSSLPIKSRLFARI